MCYNQNVMKRFIVIILALFAVLINTLAFDYAYAAQSFTKKEISVVTKDGFNIKANLSYPKDKKIKEFKTVVFLHSLGYNSQWWGNLPTDFLNKGYAVLTIDLRGHGASVYNSKLAKTSYKNLTNNAFKKYPDDVVRVIDFIKEEYPKRTFFNDWAIVGSDIGASAGIIAADRLNTKPKTIIILSPVVQARGLYIPVSIAQLDGVDFLSISSASDSASVEAEKYLKKFAQNEFVTYTSQAKSSGPVMLKNDPELNGIIVEWTEQYLNPQK